MEEHHDNHNEAQQEAHHEDESPKDLPKVRSLSVGITMAIVGVAFVGLFALGWFPRHHRMEEAQADASAMSDKPSVDIIVPARRPAAVDLVLPADVRAMQETGIFPRTNGYLKRLLVDVGDKVTEGQLLAEIDTPEVDADLNQANAALGQQQANYAKSESDLDLAETTWNRYKGIGTSGGVTQQEMDEKRAAFVQAQSNLKAAKANVAAAEASVQRLVTLQSFEKVVAPFTGSISARGFDVGALLSPSTTGVEMFHLAQTDTLRVFVSVPQNYVTSLKMGQEALLTVRNYPGKQFKGIIARASSTLDPATRTLRFEVDVPNKDGALFSGMYGQVILKSTQGEPPMMVPTSAVVFDADGTKLGVIEDGKVRFKKVEVGRDYGTEVEIATGLQGNEKVVTNPGLRLVDGAEVQQNGVKSAQAPAAQAPSGKPQQLSER